MRDISKYQGIIPAFYACYNEQGEVDEDRVERLTDYMVKKGVKGLYVGGLQENVFIRVWRTENVH